jgi:hypothetical protein
MRQEEKNYTHANTLNVNDPFERKTGENVVK